jgi:hypothetical protein
MRVDPEQHVNRIFRQGISTLTQERLRRLKDICLIFSRFKEFNVVFLTFLYLVLMVEALKIV